MKSSLEINKFKISILPSIENPSTFEEELLFNVILTGFDENKFFTTVRCLKKITDKTFKKRKYLVRNTPEIILNGVSKERAEEAKRIFEEEAGEYIRITNVNEKLEATSYSTTLQVKKEPFDISQIKTSIDYDRLDAEGKLTDEDKLRIVADYLPKHEDICWTRAPGFDLILTGFDVNKRCESLLFIQEITQKSIEECRQLALNTPSVLLKNVIKSRAKHFKILNEIKWQGVYLIVTETATPNEK